MSRQRGIFPDEYGDSDHRKMIQCVVSDGEILKRMEKGCMLGRRDHVQLRKIFESRRIQRGGFSVCGSARGQKRKVAVRSGRNAGRAAVTSRSQNLGRRSLTPVSYLFNILLSPCLQPLSPFPTTLTSYPQTITAKPQARRNLLVPPGPSQTTRCRSWTLPQLIQSQSLIAY